MNIRSNEIGKRTTVLNLISYDDKVVGIPLMVEVRERALVLPSKMDLVTHYGVTHAVLRVIPRVPGEKFTITNFNRQLIHVRQSNDVDNHQWMLSAVPNEIGGETMITFTSTSGHEVSVRVLP